MFSRKGYHSTQTKYFGTVPRSEFYGVALGYALGLFISAFLRLDTQVLQFALAVAGLFLGIAIDLKFFQEKDEPVSEEEMEEEKESSDPDGEGEEGTFAADGDQEDALASDSAADGDQEDVPASEAAADVE